MNITKKSYGNYSSDNYGAHSMYIKVGKLSLYFSYDTVVAFDNGDGLVVRQNDWSTTTGKHLNAIDGGNKKARIPGTVFEEKLNVVLKEHNL